MITYKLTRYNSVIPTVSRTQSKDIFCLYTTEYAELSTVFSVIKTKLGNHQIYTGKQGMPLASGNSKLVDTSEGSSPIMIVKHSLLLICNEDFFYSFRNWCQQDFFTFCQAILHMDNLIFFIFMMVMGNIPSDGA